MAVYNAVPYLREATESILKQTFADFEFLIIDDGSTDNSLDILKEYAAQDSRICLSSRENRGVSRTRNEMLMRALGEFIAVMDADDVAFCDRLALQVEFMRKNPETVCVGGYYQIIDGAGQLISSIQLPNNNADIQQLLVSGSSAIAHSCAMFRRSFALTVGGYDETMSAAMDFDLWLRLGEVGQLANLSHLLAKYRVHGNSISERFTQQQSSHARLACERAWQRRGVQASYQAPYSWRHEFLLECGWRAFNSAERWKCLMYGIRAVRSLPSDMRSWKLLVCAAFKPFPNPSRE